ncbi:MAG: VOC family protein, partial [Gammaproteobacteria bacterium]|nr:VOC family protein [Gammaproteobacteria bacterium]
MFSHIMVGSNDIARSKKFYDALLGALGAKPAITDDKGRLIYMHNNGLFIVTTPIDGKPATGANGGTIGF